MKLGKTSFLNFGQVGIFRSKIKLLFGFFTIILYNNFMLSDKSIDSKSIDKFTISDRETGNV